MESSVRCLEGCYSINLLNYGICISIKPYSHVVYGLIQQPRFPHFISFMADNHIYLVIAILRFRSILRLHLMRTAWSYSSRHENKQPWQLMNEQLKTRISEMI